VEFFAAFCDVACEPELGLSFCRRPRSFGVDPAANMLRAMEKQPGGRGVET